MRAHVDKSPGSSWKGLKSKDNLEMILLQEYQTDLNTHLFAIVVSPRKKHNIPFITIKGDTRNSSRNIKLYNVQVSRNSFHIFVYIVKDDFRIDVGP